MDAAAAKSQLSDEEMRRFIVNGYHHVDTDLAPEVHSKVLARLQTLVPGKANPGDNLLPLIPELSQVLSSPALNGALTSILGEKYFIMPHRHVHELDHNDDGSGRSSYPYYYHQDAHAPPVRPCHHFPRHALLLYYAQDVPQDFGPTHVVPGSQYNRGLGDDDYLRAVTGVAEPGSIYITHFDIGHGAGVNALEERRYMIKIVAMRSEEPSAPTWDLQNPVWQPPEEIQAIEPNEILWPHVWDWLCGKGNRYDSWQKGPRSDTGRSTDELIAEIESEDEPTDRVRAVEALAMYQNTKAVAALVSCLNHSEQAIRTNAIYALGALGSVAVDPLIDHLKKATTSDESPSMMKRPAGWGNPIVMDDAAFALAAIGETAVPALIDLLSHENEWARINAVFTLGEIGPAAASAKPHLADLLGDSSSRVRRTVLDAIGSIQGDLSDVVGGMTEILLSQEMEEDESTQDARVKAAVAFARCGEESQIAEAALIEALADPDYHVRYFVAQALFAIGSPQAIQAATSFFVFSSWNPDNPSGCSQDDE
jgi:HEAT repeat protein